MSSPPVGCRGSSNVPSCHHVGRLHLHIRAGGEPVKHRFQVFGVFFLLILQPLCIIVSIDVTRFCFFFHYPGNHEDNSHVSSGLLAKQAESL